MERSAQERERARLPREARRAGRPVTVEEPVPPPTDDPPPPRADDAPPPLPPRRVPTARRPAPRRPPRAPRTRHWGRRVFALIALAAIVVALYVINATFQPFHGDATG